MRLRESQREIYRRYAELALPRHTSYPTVPFWGSFGEEDLRAALERSNGRAGSLSIYVHVPFCERLCFYCTCTKEILPRREDNRAAEASARFLERIEREFARVAFSLEPGRPVDQLHLGGGSADVLLERLGLQVHACLLERLVRALLVLFALGTADTDGADELAAEHDREADDR